MTGEAEPQMEISGHQMKHSVSGLGYILFSCWPMGSHGNPQTIQAVAKAIGCCLQTDSKTLLQKTSAHPIELREVKLVPT